MANLRLINVSVVSSTDISAKFSANLNEEIDTSNVLIQSQTPGVLDPNVISASVSGDILNIVCQPLTPLAAYFIVFQSSDESLFNSINGDAVILNDGITNRQLITGPLDSNNPVQQYLTNFLLNNVYNLESTSFIYKYIQTLSTILSRSLYDIRQTKNENYLTTTITDELKTRGSGAFDRLNEESAYEVLRVGKTPTGASAPSITNISIFPSYPISLQSTNNTENLLVSLTDKSSSFNINTFTINLSKRFVIIVNSVSFVYNSSLPPYNYDISKYGYQILNSKYDPNFAFTYLLLSDSQIIINDAILSDPNFSTENIAYVQISYQYKDTGRVIDNSSLIVDTVLPSGREIVPPIENTFTLMHAPIVTNIDTIGSVGSVVFIDPNALPGSNKPHPAFIYEIPFRLDYLPSRPGEYSIDYNSGNVYVFGFDNTKDGTGAYPPWAVYLYRYTFKSEIDYVYDIDALDIVGLPNGSLMGSQANISYNYEEVLAQGIDYNADVHIEVLSEAIQNRLLALNVIQPLNFPITNVFRIFNQTSGEIYSVLRWTDNKIYFNYVKAPNIVATTGERVSFQNITNETIFVNGTSVVAGGSIFKILLNNNHIMAASEDEIGSSFNSSVFFSNTNVFFQEVYFDNTLTEQQNISKLQMIGEYQIDYTNGIVWCFVGSSQDLSVGSVSYKRGYIQTKNEHIITVNDIYYQLNILSEKTKQFAYKGFADDTILPTSFDVSDERFLMGNTSLPYQLLSSQVGTFINSTFFPGISNYVGYIRGLYEREDLISDITPINFASTATFNGKNITVSTLSFNEYNTVQFDGYQHYVLSSSPLNYLSPSIAINVQIKRLSDNAQLWDNSGTIVLGTPFKLILSGINSPNVGDAISLSYSFTINDLSRIVVDYDKGGYFVDYSYLADDIIISYEYGDNVLDFRQSSALNPGDTYYTTYKAGALRSALLRNFGTLINIPILNSLDVSFDRERYRDALMAAMNSFPEGPTLTSIKNIVNTIVHTPPDVIESAFQNWSLGGSLLSPEPISTSGSFKLVPAKYDNGVVIDTPGQTIRFPTVSNLRLEQGSFETWIVPSWDGIDNQSRLTFTITKNNVPLLPQDIFIGPAAYHPVLPDGYASFSITKQDRVVGIPNKSKNGIFIYYASDPSNKFDRWYVNILDGYSDGYNNYQISVKTDGKFYDVKSIIVLQPNSDKIFSGTNTVNYVINDGYGINQGITFVADYNHYIFDFGKDKNHNRLSIFKDESGYLNFSVFDKNGRNYIVDADVSSWSAGQKHHVAASWALNTKNNRDELHLFIDGFEVPNILKYGSKVAPYLHEKYRTIDPEEVVGAINSAIVSSTDLTTTLGSNMVSSSLAFDAYGVVNGGIIYIEEPGFSPSGYSIINVNGNVLTLATVMPISMINAAFTVNKTSFDVKTPIDLYSNIAVSLLHEDFAGSDLQITSGYNVVTSPSFNFSTLNVLPGYTIRIVGPGFATYYIILSVNGNNLILNDNMPATFSSAPFIIYNDNEQEIPGVRALHPAYNITRNDNDTITLTITDKALSNDIVLIRTLGLNHRLVEQKYYVWGNTSNVIKTRLPSPILLSDVDITHILLDGYLIGPSNSIVSAGVFVSNGIQTDQPSMSDNGRTLSVYVSGTNVDYSAPVTISIYGTNNGSSPEILTFSENGTQNTVLQFVSVSHIDVTCKPIDPTKNCIVLSVKEAFPITMSENSNVVPTIRYSYQTMSGNSLVGSGTTISDSNGLFSVESVGNYIVIYSPISDAGQYQIVGISDDHKSATLATALPVPIVSGGVYEILTVSTYRSGLQNGFFTFENADVPGQPYSLVQGLYDFKYYTYLSVPISVGRSYSYVGTDFNGNHTFNGTIDELLILSEKLTDTRIGEMVLANQETITKDFNSLKALKPTSNTLILLHFDKFPFVNDSSIYTTASNSFIQSSVIVNDNFGKSICITDKPLIIDNAGIISSKKEGSIEFWVSPLYDTANDPNYRFYFDATGMVSEKVISTNNATVKVSGRVSQILNVKLQIGGQNIDYFAGGKIDSDMQTIYLNRALPNQQTPVTVNYIPTGTNGDRISIYKDPAGYVNFDVRASGIDYQIRSPAYWVKGTWHRLKATYKVNMGLGSDEIRFFIDGYERGNVLFGNGLLFGQHQVFGSSFIGQNIMQASIVFKDTINELFIGSDYTQSNGAFALIDNLRISNISRPLFMPFGESLDVSYSPNTNIVFPVPPDLYTTLLLDFDTIMKKNTDFATLKNRISGLTDFTINIYDQFDILQNNPVSKTVLEELINVLKPAGSQAYLNYL